MLYKDMDNKLKNEISATIEFNVSEEALARKDYYKLLDMVADEHKNIIKEIIEDELNHSIILNRLNYTYSNIYPTEFQSLMNLKKERN